MENENDFDEEIVIKAESEKKCVKMYGQSQAEAWWSFAHPRVYPWARTLVILMPPSV